MARPVDSDRYRRNGAGPPGTPEATTDLNVRRRATRSADTAASIRKAVIRMRTLTVSVATQCQGDQMSLQAPNEERQIWIYTQMLRIREFEERVKRTFTEHPGVIRGHTHLGDGTEASIVCSLCHFHAGAAALATYRCHGYPLVLGSDPKAMMAEIYGRVDGLCKGLGGPMHLTGVKRGFLGTSRVVGAGVPHAAGASWAAPIPKKAESLCCIFC